MHFGPAIVGWATKKGTRMANWPSAAVIAAIAVTLLGCHKGPPTGQVAATVGGDEITLHELRAEMPVLQTADPKANKAAEATTLQAIVNRKLVAAEAVREGLDKTPSFALEKRKLTETLLIQSLEAKLARETPEPSREDAEAFISAHPNLFAERKIFDVDQIAVAPRSNIDLRALLQPLTNLDQVQAVLASNHVTQQRQVRAIDSLTLDPKLVDSIVKLPANEVFAFPSGNFVLVNQVRQVQETPFVGEPAVTYALQYLKRQRIQDAVSKELASIVARGAATVRYNSNYQPATGPAAAPVKP